MSPDVQPADSSPADPRPTAETPVDQAVALRDQGAFKLARRAERSAPPASMSSSAAATAAEPVEQVASTDAVPAPASEPGHPSPKKNAESRIQELLAERAQLRAELEAAKRPAPAPQSTDVALAASSPAPVAAKFPTYEQWTATQPSGSALDYEDYTDARARHVFEQERRAADDRAVETAKAKDYDARIATYRQHAERFVTDHPDYWTVIAPITQVQPSPTADATCDVIARAANPPQLLYHLGHHLDEFERILSLPVAQASYELGKLDASLTAPVVPSSGSRPLTSAPAPVVTLGRKAVETADETEAVVASRDQSRFKALAQRERLAQLMR